MTEAPLVKAVLTYERRLDITVGNTPATYPTSCLHFRVCRQSLACKNS